MASTAADVVRILDERTVTHGSYDDNATIVMALRSLWRSSKGWTRLRPGQQLALDESALKIARILSEGADVDAHEHWIDIAGYMHKALGR